MKRAVNPIDILTCRPELVGLNGPGAMQITSGRTVAKTWRVVSGSYVTACADAAVTYNLASDMGGAGFIEAHDARCAR